MCERYERSLRRESQWSPYSAECAKRQQNQEMTKQTMSKTKGLNYNVRIRTNTNSNNNQIIEQKLLLTKLLLMMKLLNRHTSGSTRQLVFFSFFSVINSSIPKIFLLNHILNTEKYLKSLFSYSEEYWKFLPGAEP